MANERVPFKGITYRIVDVTNSTRMTLCNAINKGILNHEGSLQKHNLNLQMITPQVYSLEGLLYAATIVGNSQYINKVWFMRGFDTIPVPSL
jgi:hypothetical protein